MEQEAAANNSTMAGNLVSTSLRPIGPESARFAGLRKLGGVSTGLGHPLSCWKFGEQLLDSSPTPASQPYRALSLRLQTRRKPHDARPHGQEHMRGKLDMEGTE